MTYINQNNHLNIFLIIIINCFFFLVAPVKTTQEPCNCKKKTRFHIRRYIEGKLKMGMCLSFLIVIVVDG